ncbi:MAG: N-acetylmuramoyl-L-alanine amidase family protein [Peptostreptococcaceae bacterium]
MGRTKRRKKRKLKKKFKKIIMVCILFLSAIIFCNIINYINELKGWRSEGFGNYEKVIVLDMGHGGKDQGTSNPNSGTLEKDIVLQVGKKISDILKKDGKLTVIETRDTDEFLSLSERVEISNKSNADIFISLHCNAVETDPSSYYGVETFYFRDDTKDSYNLAESIQNSIITNLEANDRGVKKENYYVIKNTQAAAALIEMGFLTNDSECRKLADEKYQTKMARAIVQGIYNYFSLS